ncbi:MAG: chromosome segregation protein SMC [Actinomycetota bacterium]|nr:chromosome segregation protein SMC [Actinomycetota bacterium]
MKLKHLKLRGFKSFADSTRLDFSSGVNVVVGPNGVGKSNILDAIAWVMGTQGTKSLRTEKMEDVVFAGTATRPPLPRAEVDLTFVNDDEIMPLNLAEITITRRLFRDGTSEYELNGAPCRLLDIQDLLSDGGIGKHQHVLVGQGEVGDVLNARPEDHRAVIEEAAGVTKHRSRRDRAFRRLERTDHDVARLNDILLEKRRAMRPLKRQANAAERHDSVRDEARALRLWIGGEELRAISARLESATVERTDTGGRRDEADEELDSVREALGALRSSAGSVGSTLERDTVAAARLETSRERLRRISVVSRERASAISARLAGAGERREDLEGEQRQLEDDIGTAKRDEQIARENAERKEAFLSALEDEERSLAEQTQLPAEGVVANLRGDLRALEGAERRDGAEGEQTAARMRVVDDRIASETSEIEELNRSVQLTDAEATALHDTYAAKQHARVRTESEWRDADEGATDERVSVAGALARRDAFAGAVEGLVDEEAHRIAAQAQGVLGAIVQRLDVPPEIAAAVDAALGGWSNAFVAANVSSLESVVGAVKAHGSGGVSFVVAPDTSIDRAGAVARKFGVDALVDLLGPDVDRGLAQGVLGDVVLVQGWKTGWRIVRSAPEIRAVTPEGDVITKLGMVVAQPDGAGPAALEAARVSLEGAERDLARAESREKAARRTFDAAADDERSALETLEAAEARLAGFAEAIGLVDRARAASRAERERLSPRLEALHEAGAERTERIGQLRERVSDFEGEEAVRQEAWEALNRRREEVANRRDDAKRKREQATAELASVVERLKMMESRLRVVASDVTQLVLVPAVSDDDVDRLHGISARAESAINAVSSHIETLRERQREMRGRLGEANRELGGAEERREELERSTRMLGDTLAALDVELAELAVRHEAVLERLRRDSDATREQAMGAERPELDEGSDPKQRLESLEADLRRMGPINPLAAQEYADLAAGAEELDTQLQDLNESRQELRKVIAALDDKMASLFLEAFEEISAFYSENFALVFPGGVGGLSLTDSDDPLSMGVVVEAQPAGKRVGKLSLLSGGERSLAALAFLFAVFRARPSPFYVLDEVDAALDDANLHRFLRLVDTLRENVQLVIITHQQQTMEAADVLYGVTMAPGESSVVLSKRMTGNRLQVTGNR